MNKKGRPYEQIIAPTPPMAAIPAELVVADVSDGAFRLYAHMTLLGEALSQTHLAEDIGQGASTVQLHLAELRAKGWLIRRRNPRTGNLAHYLQTQPNKETA